MTCRRNPHELATYLQETSLLQSSFRAQKAQLYIFNYRLRKNISKTEVKRFPKTSIFFTSMFTKNTTQEGKTRGYLMLKQFLRMLQKGISIMARRGRTEREDSDEKLEASTMVADDVKEGHFVVFAVKGENARRFVVDLEFLSDPHFLRLLEEAEEEYGFEQKGALEIPCQPEELQRILEEKREKRISVRQWIRVNLSSIAELL